GSFRVLEKCLRGSSYHASDDPCATHSLAVLLIGLFPLQVLDCSRAFAGNRVERDVVWRNAYLLFSSSSSVTASLAVVGRARGRCAKAGTGRIRYRWYGSKAVISCY